MLSILSTEPATEEISAGPAIHFEDSQAAEPAEPVEFEIVLGRRQLASVLFVATVVIAVLSSLGYLAGKSFAPAPKMVEVIRTVRFPSSKRLSRPGDLAVPVQLRAADLRRSPARAPVPANGSGGKRHRRDFRRRLEKTRIRSFCRARPEREYLPCFDRSTG